MKQILFIGSRYEVLSGLLETESLDNCELIVLQKSHLSSELDKQGIAYHSFSLSEKKSIVQHIAKASFDVLISSGCPFILPVSSLKKENQHFYNIHPSYLPYLKGKTQMNGTLYYDMKFLGATMHIMDDDLDAGNIIAQDKIELTEDLDMGLIYYISYELEKFVFKKGWQLLKDHNFSYNGLSQVGEGSWFNREDFMMRTNPALETNKVVLKKIKTFGVKTQGVEMVLNDRGLMVYDADEITNKFLMNYYNHRTAGDVVLEYDDKILIKSKEGLLRLKSFQKI